MLKRKLYQCGIAILLVLVFLLPNDSVPKVYAEELMIESPSAILIEASTGQIIYEKNADEKLRPASVTKIMTLLLIFERIDSGQMHLDDIVTVSEHAASMGGSQCFFEAGETQTVEDMIKCIVIASGNDAAVAMAEHVAGSEPAFVDMMNARALELGMNNTNFENACGLEAEGHVTTARDIAIMSRELTVNHPAIFNYSTIWMDSITHVTRRGESEFGLNNTNKFLNLYNGATGLKTGYTSIAKYSMSATATRNGVDLIAVIMGAETKDLRNEEACKLLDYGFAKCQIYTDENVFDGIEAIPLSGGKTDTVEFEKEQTFQYIFVNGQSLDAVEKKVTLEEVKAPVAAGTILGYVNYYYEGEQIGAVPIMAAEDVEAATYGFCFYQVFLKFLCG